MDRRIFGAAVLAGVIAVPAQAADVLVYPTTVPDAGSPVYAAQSIITADIALALGYEDFEGNSAEGQGFAAASGRVNFPLWGSLYEEVEIGGVVGFEDGSGFGVFSHTYHKTQGAAFGVLLGAAEANGGFDNPWFQAGLEGAIFLPQTTFVGTVAYNWPNKGDNFWTIGGEARWYWEPNTKIYGSVAWNSDGQQVPEWLLAAGLEHRFQGTQFSLFGEGRWNTLAMNNNKTIDGWGILGGARVFFDTPGSTLQQYDWHTPFRAVH
jgi:hypothetical protein